MIWNIHGVMYPVAPNELGHSENRSPYNISMSDFINIFATSQERIEILKGLLAYRAVLYGVNVTRGFQWINGSFTENVEVLRGRPPSDVDVVTFANMIDTIPDYNNWAMKNHLLFSSSEMKAVYKVDCYWLDLDLGFNAHTVERCTYWYSMWSHQKVTDLWKGFFCIPLSPSEDLLAQNMLLNINIEKDNA